MIPVYPDDCKILGMWWEGLVYVDKVIPIGGTSREPLPITTPLLHEIKVV